MTDRTEAVGDEAIAAALEDFHRRKALGEVPRVDDYAERLGASHAEFREIVETEDRLDFAMAPPALEPLPRTFDGYTLLRELGRGAAGVVYEALDRNLGRKVALKILRTGFDTDSTARERFRREAKECAHVRHDNIVPIFEAGEEEGRPFYAMDVVPGEPLSALIKSRRVPKPEALCAGLAGIAGALEALHAAGIWHRDVKPQNIMVRPDGRMVLADFGLARSAEAQRLTQTGDAVGTPLYMSPEQMLGQSDQVDARSDVWGLGVTLYEALAGRPPFQTDETAALIKMILMQQPEPIRKFAAHVPAECEGIALKAIQKEKADRYTTASEMAADLRAFAEGRPVLGKPVTPIVRSLREVRKRWIPIAVAAALLVAGMVTWSRRDGSLEILPGKFPPAGAMVSIDGEAPVKLPVTKDLAPGTHKIVWRHEWVSAEPEQVTVEPGAKVKLTASPSVNPDKANQAEVRDALAQAWGFPGAGAADDKARDAKVQKLRGSAVRGADRSAMDLGFVELLVPRGDVRLADLSSLVFLIDDEIPLPAEPVDGAAEATLEFRRGTEILWSQPFHAKNFKNWLEMPAAVREKVRVGDTVTWSWVPATPTKELQAVSATFKVVAPDAKVAEEIRAVDATLSKQAPSLLRYFRGKAYASHGLQTAAFFDLYAAAEADPKDELAWRGLRTVLMSIDLPPLTNAVLDVDDWIHDMQGRPPSFKPQPAKKQ